MTLTINTQSNSNNFGTITERFILNIFKKQCDAFCLVVYFILINFLTIIITELERCKNKRTKPRIQINYGIFVMAQFDIQTGISNVVYKLFRFELSDFFNVKY